MQNAKLNIEDSMRELNLKNTLSKIRKKILVLSGKGGVGKSTVSVNVAFGLAIKGFKVGILDIDIHGPSIAKMTGIEGKVFSEFGEDGRPMPIKIAENLWAMTIASLLKNPDDPIIWRGPLKMGAIKQFLGDIAWPELDYLVIDSPPGTGDEPLTIVQLIGEVDGAIVVTTPQDVALIDVRRTVRFCEQLKVPILGIVENMSAFKCPHCGKPIDIFKGIGAEVIAKDYNIDILGKIPIDPNIVESTDKGIPYIYHYAKIEGGKAFDEIVEKVINKTNK
jgi:Mrp family chromosome partitioning ATPase